MKNIGLYIHVPFCLKKCNYCDFLSFQGLDSSVQKAYFHSLLEEVRQWGEVYGNEFYVDSLFIGGGTPSLVDSAFIKELMVALKNHFFFLDSCEITIESNPKTLTEEKLTAYLDCGINRLSLGVQSMDEGLLKLMGRAHSPEDVLENYRLARICGFQNINLDVMFAVPKMTMEIWKNTIEQVLSLSPEHISMYSLQLEEGTPFFRDFEGGILQEIPDDLDRKMYWEGLDYITKAGYDHYEISNLAKPGFACKHNLKYWSMEDYLGIGLGAHSFVKDHRFSNEANLDAYINNSGNLSQETFISEEGTKESSKSTNRQSEYVFTGMRKIQGISKSEFKRKYGVDFMAVYGSVVTGLQRENYMVCQGDFIKFTPLGIDLSNGVLAEFL